MITQNQRIHLENIHLKLWGDIVRLLKSKSFWYLKHYFIPEHTERPELLISYMKHQLLVTFNNYGYDYLPPNNCFLCEIAIINRVNCNQCQYFKIKCNEGDSLWRRLYYAVKSQNEPLALKLATEIRDVVINKIG
jgi:hypothetical protein